MWRFRGGAQGFTLVEILIVFSLLGLTMALVAPIGIEQVEKIGRKSDEKKLDSLINAVYKYAFWTNKTQLIRLSKNKVEVIDTGKVVSFLELSYVNFENHEITLESSGTYSPCLVSAELIKKMLDKRGKCES